jgi:aminopeptidase YwaD
MKFMIKSSCGFILMAVIFSGCSGGRTGFSTSEFTRHIKYLSSDSLKGRLTGSSGDSLAAEYIKAEFTSRGLVPLSGDGLERFKVTEKVMAGKDNSLAVNGKTYAAETDFTPVSFSENGTLKADVVFAGYGFRINNDSLKWDDYNGVDIKNKWVMILRSDPEPDVQNSKFAPFSSDRNKAMVAKDLGAAGVLFVSGQSFDNSDSFDPLSKGAYSVGIPVFRIKRSVADEILLKSKHNIDDLEKKINTGKKPLSLPTGAQVEAKSEILSFLTNTRNVIMLLPGEDETLKNEYIVLGGHFDHLGMGGPGSGSRAGDTLGVHHGADDNASGIAMLIEMAGKFAGTKNSHKRSLVFVAFTGEEEGLLGSKYFTDNPLIDLSKVDAMLNFDMVGRLKDTKEMQIMGVGTADSLRERIISKADTNTLKISFIDEGSGPSDYSSFYSKNIPVLFFYTGAHPDYHTPADTWDKINYKGMVSIADLAFRVTSGLANETSRLKFKEAGQKDDPNRLPRRRGITLGIMPDVTGSIKNGLKVEAVTAGRPGAIGGMKKGDIIVGIEGKAVNNIGDYMFRMSQVKKGQRITVEVLRNDKKEVLIIQL